MAWNDKFDDRDGLLITKSKPVDPRAAPLHLLWQLESRMELGQTPAPFALSALRKGISRVPNNGDLTDRLAAIERAMAARETTAAAAQDVTPAVLLTEMKPRWRDALTGHDVSREYLAGFIRRNRGALESALEPIVSRMNFPPVDLETAETEVETERAATDPPDVISDETERVVSDLRHAIRTTKNKRMRGVGDDGGSMTPLRAKMLKAAHGMELGKWSNALIYDKAMERLPVLEHKAIVSLALSGKLRILQVWGAHPDTPQSSTHYRLVSAVAAPSLDTATSEPADDIPEPKLGDKVPTPPKPPRGEPPWRPTWAANADGRMPVWALPPTDGLAIQITPHQASKRSKIEWRLAILHLGTGFTVVSRRAGHGDTDIDWSIDNFRRMQGLLTDLLAIGSWEIEMTPDVIAARTPLIRAAMARHVPAIPEWRAWRSKHTKREAKEQALDHRWFTDEQEAMEWAQGADWWLVEQWVTPPLYRNYDNGNIARYIDGVFPDGCVRATWGGHGWQRSSSPGVMASAMPSPPVDHQADVDMLKAYSWEDARWEKRTPTGDLPPRLLSLLNNGLLRLVDDYFCPSVAAMRQMLRARRREKVTPLTSTCKAYSEWKSLQKKALQGRSGELARGGAEHMSARFSALCHLAACIDRDSVPPLPHWDRGWIGHRPSTTQVLSYEDGIACIEMTGYSVKNVWATFETEPCVPWAPNSALTVKRYPSLERGYTDLFDTTLEEHSSRQGAEQFAMRLREAVRFAGPRRSGPAAPIAKMLAKRQADELAARELEEAGREPPPEPFLIFMGPQGRSAKPLSELRVLLDAENPGAWEEAQANVAIYDDPIGDLGRWYAHDHGLTYEGVESLGVRFSRWESDQAEREHLRRVAPDTYARLVSVDRLHRGQAT
jgi:hypothetical protein